VSEPLLRLQDVRVWYGRVPALFGVSLEVAPGEVVALLGPNGAGKSTTLRAISGVVRPVGLVEFDGRQIDGRSPDTIARLGIAQVPEGRGLFPSLTVMENLQIGGYVAPRGTDVAAEIERALSLFPVLGARARQPAGTLSGGEQQMLAIGRALISRPRLLLIDELSLGLAPTIVAGLFSLIPEIAASGTAVLLVEQFVGHALNVASRAYVLEKGGVSWAGPAATLADRREFVEASYLGNGRSDRRARRSGATPFVEQVAVDVPVAQLRALQREAAAGGITVERILADRLRTPGGAS